MGWGILLQPKESIRYDELLPRELLEIEAVEALERWKGQEMGSQAQGKAGRIYVGIPRHSVGKKSRTLKV
jgi:hypothetical protein